MCNLVKMFQKILRIGDRLVSNKSNIAARKIVPEEFVVSLNPKFMSSETGCDKW